MTGTEERAALEALALIRSGSTQDEALKEIASAYNLNTTGVAAVARAIADHL